MKNGAAVLAGALLAVTLGSNQAAAQLIAGTTQGCFGVGCTPTTDIAIFQGLTYTAGSFATTNGNVGGTVLNNLGSFTLINPPDYNYTNEVFRLFISFTDPSTSSGSPIFGSAIANGNVQLTTDGLRVNFDNPLIRSTTLADGTIATVEVPNFVAVNANNGPVYITATVTASPEPASLVLLGTGLVGIFGAVRRRRTQLN